MTNLFKTTKSLQNNESENAVELKTGERLKILRAAYELKAKDAAQICNVTYRNYQKYENGISEPPLSRLSMISTYTAVSLDWLCGISDVPYSKGYIQSLEKRLWTYKEKNKPVLLSQVYNDILNKTENIQIYPYSELSIIEEYANSNKREQYYPLAARANIIFLMNKFIDLVNTKGTFSLFKDGEVIFDHNALHAEHPVSLLHYFGLGLPKFLLEGSDAENILNRSKSPLFNIEKICPSTDEKIRNYFSRL